jgi:predicted small lipoprotein YifL
MIRQFAAAFAVLSLAACGSEAPEAPPADDPSLAPLDNPVAPGESLSATTIPVAMHGRWGLVPGDCTSVRGDNKGLITIDARTIKFYESLATLDTVKDASETRFLGSFDFTGEGQEWTVDEQLDLRDDGTLVRSEQGEGAMAGPLVYAPCE